jgi:hypothetical protein
LRNYFDVVAKKYIFVALLFKRTNIMQEKIKSEGKCLFCGKTFAKAGINRHLATHLNEKVGAGVSGKSFLVKVETAKRWGSTPFFLSLWIDGETKLKNLDTFLRGIWLECCGHMSAFSDSRGEIAMSRKVKDIFRKEIVVEYEYDFGSSTNLSITVVDEYPIKADKKIVLLSRNEPLQVMCSMCGKVPATQICSVCMYDGNALFCDKCAKKHAKECEDFADYASMPVCNSPRAGVCAYDGGTIDKERDGVYRM